MCHLQTSWLFELDLLGDYEPTHLYEPFKNVHTNLHEAWTQQNNNFNTGMFTVFVNAYIINTFVFQKRNAE